MLVLSRKPGERVVIGDNIVVTLVAVEGGRARLGFDCPRNIPIRRQELPKFVNRMTPIDSLCRRIPETVFYGDFV